MLKKILFIGIIFAVGVMFFCLGQIHYDLSMKEDNTAAVEVIE